MEHSKEDYCLCGRGLIHKSHRLKYCRFCHNENKCHDSDLEDEDEPEPRQKRKREKNGEKNGEKDRGSDSEPNYERNFELLSQVDSIDARLTDLEIKEKDFELMKLDFEKSAKENEKIKSYLEKLHGRFDEATPENKEMTLKFNEINKLEIGQISSERAGQIASGLERAFNNPAQASKIVKEIELPSEKEVQEAARNNLARKSYFQPTAVSEARKKNNVTTPNKKIDNKTLKPTKPAKK